MLERLYGTPTVQMCQLLRLIRRWPLLLGLGWILVILNLELLYADSQ